ncbi:CLUMA_CG016940, isoform A [Clunio marinus]|uniref:CLUMA_CG016940, isoform A n=1 Tax=Clunio marinus TaxID=568069 RepID=A0A1J1ISM4_9DIPT|nr:CLUMA_CG016940, isoform A [Clunio marinus]
MPILGTHLSCCELNACLLDPDGSHEKELRNSFEGKTELKIFYIVDKRRKKVMQSSFLLI